MMISSIARSSTALGLAKPAARLQSLLDAHEKLLKKTLRKRRELERFQRDLRDVGRTLASRAVPMLDEAFKLDAAVHASFDKILAENHAKRVRLDILDVYQELQDCGVITPRGSSLRDMIAEHEPSDSAQPHREPPAAHRGRAPHLRDIRAMFLNLAEALHPDKVQDEGEKATRTEAMKEVNRAYRDGDLARLLEIQRDWTDADELGRSSALDRIEIDEIDEIERQCQSLMRKNELLQEQFAELCGQLRALRRSEPGNIVIDIRRLRREKFPDPISILIVPLEEGIKALRDVHDSLEAYHRGERSLDDVLAELDPEMTDEEWEQAERELEALFTGAFQHCEDMTEDENFTSRT